MRGLLLTLAGVLATTAALAHDSFISRKRLLDPESKEWCCNRNDCAAEPVREVTGGYLTKAGDVIPYRRVIWASEDGRWWRCRHLEGPKRGWTRCLIGPPPNS